MTIRKRMVLPLALAVGSARDDGGGSVANATHPRPKGATPIAGIARARVQRMRDTEPHARDAAGVPVLQPAGADLDLPDHRLARRERRRGELDRVHQASP